jgi:hypothetical protein
MRRIPDDSMHCARLMPYFRFALRAFASARASVPAQRAPNPLTANYYDNVNSSAAGLIENKGVVGSPSNACLNLLAAIPAYAADITRADECNLGRWLL